jgi:phage-related protein
MTTLMTSCRQFGWNVGRFGTVCLLVLLIPQGACPQTVVWTRQFGTDSIEESFGVSADGLGNVYVSGYTYGNLSGPNAGWRDAFVRKYDAAGNFLWSQQLGTSSIEESLDVSADGLGNVYISGYTLGSLGGANSGGGDAFLSKYDGVGNFLWTRQFGTGTSDYGGGVSADGLGNVYIAGATRGSLGGPNAGDFDAFVRKYDDDGVLLWTRQLGMGDDDFVSSVSSDGLGNVYIAGRTDGSLGGPNAGDYDALVSKYDDAGNLLWTRQFGTSGFDYSLGVSADLLGNVYLSGRTGGNLGDLLDGTEDAFVSKYDGAGNLLWIRQLGTSTSDWSYGVSADGQGDVYISGYTGGNLGDSQMGGVDAFVSKYDGAGNLLWTQQLGTTDIDYSCAVSADGLGNVYISGSTLGDLGGPNAGDYDAWVARISEVPEPSALVLALVALVFLTGCRRQGG